MANPPKQKGTAAETELVRKLNEWFGEGVFKRNETNGLYDIFRPEHETPGMVPFEVLATRPDRGQWLLTMNFDDFCGLLEGERPWCPVHIEVKRYARFSLHSIFEKKFGRRP